MNFAQIAEENDYVCPEITEDIILRIEKGRHPIVEQKQENFVPNDLFLDGNLNRMILITGPNMGGKSTYMRQAALITIMAQIGSFVPAQKAVIGICDSIFTRIGASDDLSLGQSTFMVEMIEMANILNNMSNRSLILLDEVGRGTSTHDGLAIASAIVEYMLRSNLTIRSLFATHYHELVAFSDKFPIMLNYHAAVTQKANDILFLHEIKPGASDDSFGIEVAALAGLPKSLIKKSKHYLQALETKKNSKQEFKEQISFVENILVQDEDNYDMYHDEKNREIVTKIEKLNINELSPIQALQILNSLQEEAKKLNSKE